MSKTKLVALVFQEEQQQAMIAAPGAPPVTHLDSQPDIALGVLKTIDQKAKEAGVKLEDLVVVFKTERGELKIKQTRDVTAGKGAKRGSFWGLLVGLIFGGPLAGVLWGLGIGALYGRMVDHGIDDKFIQNVGNALLPGRSAVLILLDEADYEPAMRYLRTYETDIYEADFSEEAQVAISKVSEHGEIIKAVGAEYETDS